MLGERERLYYDHSSISCEICKSQFLIKNCTQEYDLYINLGKSTFDTPKYAIIFNCILKVFFDSIVCLKYVVSFSYTSKVFFS